MVLCGRAEGVSYAAMVESAQKATRAKQPRGRKSTTALRAESRIVRLGAADFPSLVESLRSASAAECFEAGYRFGPSDRAQSGHRVPRPGGTRRPATTGRRGVGPGRSRRNGPATIGGRRNFPRRGARRPSRGGLRFSRPRLPVRRHVGEPDCRTAGGGPGVPRGRCRHVGAGPSAVRRDRPAGRLGTWR